MTLEDVGGLVAENLELLAPVVALVAAWLLYGVLGKRALGADDDFWPAIRSRVLPLLDSLAAGTPGLYAVGRSTTSEYAGSIHYPADMTTAPVDRFERALERAGYYRNPMAAYKTDPAGRTSVGSWARRYGRVRGLGDALRTTYAEERSNVPHLIRAPLGRFLQATGDITATRQVHVTLYRADSPDGTRIHVFAHDEPNSINPFTAFSHYRGRGWDDLAGVNAVREDLADEGVQLRFEDA